MLNEDKTGKNHAAIITTTVQGLKIHKQEKNSFATLKKSSWGGGTKMAE